MSVRTVGWYYTSYERNCDVCILHRITLATEVLFKKVQLSENVTIKQSERNIGTVTTCTSSIGNQTVKAELVDDIIVLSIDSNKGK